MNTLANVTPVRIQVPSREDLLAKIEQANRFVWPTVLIQTIGIIALAVSINWLQVFNSPFLYVVAISVVLGPFVLQVMQILAQNKKEIGKLRETTVFGLYDKYLLQDLFNNTLEKLGLPKENLPVYITADRTMNAMASNIGLGFFSRFINGIYLHRQLLHKLEPEEVQDIMGHELGHYYAHYLKRTRYHFLSCLLGGLLAVAVAQWLGLDSLIGYLMLFGCATVAFYFTSRIRVDQMQAIEYLCDDFGAHVNGIAVSINGLMKLGASAEIETAIFYEAVLSNQFAKLSAAEVLETLQQAIPYGHVSAEELEQTINAQLKKRSTSGPTVAGFLKHAWQADEEIARYAQAYQQLRKRPRLDWESLLEDPTRIEFSGQSLERLIELIESNPDLSLFHDASAGNEQLSHPPTKMRILYLWHNRQAIENNSALPSELAMG